MQAAKLGNDIVARPQGQVVGIAQDHLGAELLELIWRQALDRCLCTHGHKNRGVNHAVRGCQLAHAGLAVGRDQIKAER
jgi:hypothetical protein